MGSQLNADTPLLIANFKTRPHEWGERRTGKVRRYIWQTLQRYEPVPEEKKRKKNTWYAKHNFAKEELITTRKKKGGGGSKTRVALYCGALAVPLPPKGTVLR